MNFYSGHTLSNTADRNSFFTKEKLVLPDKILNKVPTLAQANLTIQIYNHKEDCMRRIYLYADDKCIASCTLSTVEYNCSAIMVANLYTENYYNKGLGWFLLDLIEQWAIYAGYTLLIGNTAGREQNNLIYKFKKKGWIESNIQYVNARTSNKNIWLYKVIAEAIEQEEADDYYEEDTDSNEDEDF